MLYTPSNHRVNGGATGDATHVTTVTGRRLSRMKSTPARNAFLAVDLYRGTIRVNAFTVAQVAALAGVNVDYVQRALAASPAERTAVLTGRAKLHQLKTGGGETLASHITRSSPEQLRDAARVVGVDAIWDRMISPML
jgi:hypothetical protein